ncbi:hypothetical protein GQX74_005943 [Glossina fuscipes]|nr:hypothetical protein GQX74_005943 [Glossina fuscipes]
MDDQTELKTGVDSVQCSGKKLDKALLALKVRRTVTEQQIDRVNDFVKPTTLKVSISRLNNSDSNQTIHISHTILSDEKYDTLSPAAKAAIAGIKIIAENYEKILQRLKDRFENKKIIGKQHIKQIFEHPKIIHANAAGLRELIDTMNNHLIGLKNINRPVESWDDLMVYLITSKLDPDTLNKWNEKEPIDCLPTLSELLNFLKGRRQILQSKLSSVSLPGGAPTSRAIGPRRVQRTSMKFIRMPNLSGNPFCDLEAVRGQLKEHENILYELLEQKSAAVTSDLDDFEVDEEEELSDWENSIEPSNLDSTDDSALENDLELAINIIHNNNKENNKSLIENENISLEAKEAT